MTLNIKPVVILSRGAGVFIDGDGRMEMVLDGAETKVRINTLVQEVKSELEDRATILEALVVSAPDEWTSLIRSGEEIDALLVLFIGVTPIEELLRWPGPIIAFGGQYTPAMALYAVGEERRERPDLFIALDYEEIRKTLLILETRKALARTRILLFGFPPSWHLRWYGYPDLEGLRRRLGVEFVPVELRELIDKVQKVDTREAARVAERWVEEAQDVEGPSNEHLRESAETYLAMRQIMERRGANAMAINCLEITQTRKFSGLISNPCMGMQYMRDGGVPTGCEMDIPGLLTMIILGHLSRRPAFLGNIVRAEPEGNVIKISHCILPTRMPGFDKDPLPYTLCDYHGTKGVTGFTRVPSGQTVTLARAQRNLERISACAGELLGCDNTEFCRNTLTIRLSDARRFVQRAEGNHHALIFGDCIEKLEALCALLDCEFQHL